MIFEYKSRLGTGARLTHSNRSTRERIRRSGRRRRNMFSPSCLVLLAALLASSQLASEARVSNGAGSGGVSVRDVTRDVLQLHNNLRRNHSAKALSVDSEVAAPQAASNSLRRARTVAQQGRLEHEQQSKYGENLAMSSDQEASLESLVMLWYNEKDDYDYSRPGFSMATGHFTQLVWKSTKGLGCSLAQTSDGPRPGAYLACNYSPPGNYEGQYEQNVSSQ